MTCYNNSIQITISYDTGNVESTNFSTSSNLKFCYVMGVQKFFKNTE